MEDQQLLLDEQGFGDHGTRATRTSQSGDGREQMQKKIGQIAHRRNSSKIAKFILLIAVYAIPSPFVSPGERRPSRLSLRPRGCTIGCISRVN
jgi:hypothetical protein